MDGSIVAAPAPSNREAALDAMYSDMADLNLFGYWARDKGAAHDDTNVLTKDTPRAIPMLWSYAGELLPMLQRSAELVSTEDSERRSLILRNPGLGALRATVSTMYTAYRQNDPSGVMPPHRHTASAIRLGLHGQQNFTGVEGEDIVFGHGDMVLTPRDTWHNHGNFGNAPATNLSVLDVPLVETFNALSFDHDYAEDGAATAMQSARFSADYSAQTYGHGGMVPRFVDHYRGAGDSSPMYVYRYDAMRTLLERHRDHEGSPYEGLTIEYVDPLRGTPVFKTMTFFMQMLRPGEKTRPMRQTSNHLVSPLEGSGHAVVDGKRFDWAQYDTLAVPGGCWAEFANGSETEPAILFIASDEPAVKHFGLLKRWGRNEAGDVVRLV